MIELAAALYILIFVGSAFLVIVALLIGFGAMVSEYRKSEAAIRAKHARRVR